MVIRISQSLTSTSTLTISIRMLCFKIYSKLNLQIQSESHKRIRQKISYFEAMMFCIFSHASFYLFIYLHTIKSNVKYMFSYVLLIHCLLYILQIISNCYSIWLNFLRIEVCWWQTCSVIKSFFFFSYWIIFYGWFVRGTMQKLLK